MLQCVVLSIAQRNGSLGDEKMATVWDEIFTSAANKEAKKRYAIAFTPRSGSTMLGDILCRSEVLGLPKEWFNPALRRRLIETSGCRNLNQYYRHLKTVHNAGEVFGVELAWNHAELVFETANPNFFDDIDSWFFLRRRDYVAQGVSLHKALQSGVYHSIQEKNPRRQASYNGIQIMKMILRIFRQEAGFEGYFGKSGREVNPLWYEEITAQPPQQVLATFARTLALPPNTIAELESGSIESEHRKLSDAKSEVMVRRFREEYPEFIDYWDKNRGISTVREFIENNPQYDLKS
jgi:trehalose 2-sulfotransferase